MDPDVQKRKPRVALSLSEATLILQKHGLGLSCTKVEYLNKVFNWRNSSYIITSSEGKEYFLRFSKNWGEKCENERAAISFLRAHCPSLPVPEVLGFQNNYEVPGENEPFDYILFQKLPGVPLGDVFKSFSLVEKKKIVTNLVDILFQLQQVKFDKIGSFTFVSSSEEEVEIGPDFLLKTGPFDNYLSYMRALIQNEVKCLSECAFLLEGLDFEGLKKRIDNLLEKVAKDPSPHFFEVPFLFTHRDFHSYNLLVDEDRMEMTGLIDFEFSGSYPTDLELEKCLTFISDEYSFVELERMSHVCTRFVCESEEEMEQMVDHFLKECQRVGMRTPFTIPGYDERMLLHSFAENICPWWVRDWEERGHTIERGKEERDKSRKEVEEILEVFKC